MRHQKKTKTFSRKKASRQALFKNLAASLILHEKIKTTQAKAKALRPIVEKIISLSRDNTLANRRSLLAKLPTEKVVKKILEEIGPRYKERKGGYCRIVKLGKRQGDGAEMALIELV